MSYSKCSGKDIFSIVESLIANSERKHRLDIGSGGTSKEFITLDKHSKADISGDIRVAFAPVYMDKAKQYKQILGIEKVRFQFVKMSHIVEHIEWIYQKWMFEWVYSLMQTPSSLFIETPNLRWICQQYVDRASIDTQALIEEHPDLTGEYADFQRWMNYKIYSGASTNAFDKGGTDGDFHLCMYDADLLYDNLNKCGFDNIYIAEEETLLCVADKK